MNVDNSTHLENGLACKDKWSAIAGKFKKIHDHNAGTGNNENYWNMNAQDKTTFNLLWNFGRGMFKMIQKFLMYRPVFEPLHMRDSMDKRNDIFNPTNLTQDEPIDLVG
jgi:hypothetical protein